MKNTVTWTYVNSDLNGEETFGKFDEKELQRTNQTEFRNKGNKIHSVTGLVWNIYYKDESIFYWTVWILVRNVKVELDLSNYATKVDLQRATVVDTSMLAAETDLASLTAQFDKLLVDKLKNFPVDL